MDYRLSDLLPWDSLHVTGKKEWLKVAGTMMVEKEGLRIKFRCQLWQSLCELKQVMCTLSLFLHLENEACKVVAELEINGYYVFSARLTHSRFPIDGICHH